MHSIDEIKKYIESDEENFVIGGAMIYNLLMPYVTKMYITEIDKNFEGDSVFPPVNLEKWKEVKRVESKDDNLEYSFVDYERI